VRSPAPSDDSNLFSIGPNALILNQASPEALSAAIYLLATNRTLAQALAEAGYRTVEAQFSVSSQVKLYELLYSASVSRVQW
jgi:glycosyltransferase involved in cell wall biosynthesis